MPTCNNCGNQLRFDYRVEAGEERFFDRETGEHYDTRHEEVYNAHLRACGECGSEDVDPEPQP